MIKHASMSIHLPRVNWHHFASRILTRLIHWQLIPATYLLGMVLLLSGCATGLVNERVEQLKDDSITGTDSKPFQSQIDNRGTVIRYKGKMFLGTWGRPDSHTFLGKSEMAGFVTYLKFGTEGNGRRYTGLISDNIVVYDREIRYKNSDSGQDLEVGVIFASRDDQYSLLDINKGGTIRVIYNSTLDRDNRSIRAYYVYAGDLYVSNIDVQFSPQIISQARIALLQSMYLVTVPLDLSVLPLQPLLCYITLMSRMGDGSH